MKQTRARAIEIFESFRQSTPARLADLPAPWPELSARAICRQSVFGGLALYMTEEMVIPAGKKNEGRHYAYGTILDYLGALLNQSYNRFIGEADADQRIFFTCLDTKSSTDSARWWKGVKNYIVRTCFTRMRDAGEEMDKSAPLITLPHVKWMCRALAIESSAEVRAQPLFLDSGARARCALARASSIPPPSLSSPSSSFTSLPSPWPQSMNRKLAIKTAYLAAGRSAEPAGMHWDGLQYDALFKGTIAEVAQTKTSKLKLIFLGAGADRHSCWLTDMGDSFITSPPLEPYKMNEAAWLLPGLNKVANPGEKLGSYIKALQPVERGGAVAYKEVAVASLPEGASAAGLRPGTCNHLATGMPGEFVVHTSGHEMKAGCSVYDYIDASVAKCIPGFLVLAGWPPLPWGQLGMGPTPPDLTVLEAVGETEESLIRIIHELFHLDTASPPMLLPGGSMRQLVLDIFATIVMYHEERVAAGEVRNVAVALEALVPRETLYKWGRRIKSKFQSDNARLYNREADTGSVQLAEAMGQQGALVATQQREIFELRSEVTAMRSEMTAMRSEFSMQFSTMIGILRGAPPELVAASSAESVATPTGHVAPSSAESTAPAPPVTPTAVGTPSDTMGSLLPVHAAQDVRPAVITGKTAAKVYQEVILVNGEPPSGISRVDKQRVRIIVSWFNAMATAE